MNQRQVKKTITGMKTSDGATAVTHLQAPSSFPGGVF